MWRVKHTSWELQTGRGGPVVIKRLWGDWVKPCGGPYEGVIRLDTQIPAVTWSSINPSSLHIMDVVTHVGWFYSAAYKTAHQLQRKRDNWSSAKRKWARHFSGGQTFPLILPSSMIRFNVLPVVQSFCCQQVWVSWNRIERRNPTCRAPSTFRKLQYNGWYSTQRLLSNCNMVTLMACLLNMYLQAVCCLMHGSS